MQLKYLWISKYKNLENIKFRFNSDLISLLVGQNGLGKSNLLESIAIIFSNLDLADRETNFTTEPFNNFFEFQVWYSCKNTDVRIKAQNSTLLIEIKSTAATDEQYSNISFAEFKRKRSDLMPDYIIGYYSGENSRIATFFSKHSALRINNLKKRDSIDLPALGRMFFAEENCGHLVLFTLWIYKNSIKFGKKINELLSNFIRIEDASEIQIAFCNPEFSKTYPNQNADNLISNMQDAVENPFWGITGKIDRFLNILFENHTTHSIPRSFEDDTFDSNSGKTGFVFFEHLNYDQLYFEIDDQFNDPAYVFDVLHAAYQLGIVYKIDGVLTKHGVRENHNFNELSEGERQLLTILGLILITGKDDCLFLLDEPDTHLNPKWQREFVQLLHNFNRNRNIDTNRNDSHILVCTHSPLIVQASDDTDIFLFKKSREGAVEVIFNDFKIQNWRIDQVLVSEYFELPSARPPALDEFMLLRERILSKSGIDQEDQELLANFEDELGIFPTGETMEQIEAMLLIKKVATKINQNDQNT
jgi:predicted ATPase